MRNKLRNVGGGSVDPTDVGPALVGFRSGRMEQVTPEGLKIVLCKGNIQDQTVSPNTSFQLLLHPHISRGGADLFLCLLLIIGLLKLLDSVDVL